VPDSEITAALRAIRSELEVSGATYADESRLLRLAGDAVDLAEKWRRQSTTGRDATAQCADELRTLLERKLLAGKGSGVHAEIEADRAERGGSLNPTPDCGYLPRKPPAATELWWCGDCREFHQPGQP
jgi:hypothetical protein